MGYVVRNLLLLAAVMLVGYSLVNIWRKPGFFGAVLVCSYGLGTLSGSFGSIAALAAMAASAFAAGAAAKSYRGTVLAPGEVWFAIWVAESIVLAYWSPNWDVTGEYLLSLFALDLMTYFFARTFSGSEGFFRDLLWGSLIAITISYFSVLDETKTLARLGTGGVQRNPVGLSVLCELGLILSMAMLFFDRSATIWQKLVVAFFVVVIAVPFTAATGTRGVVASCGIVFLFFLVLFIWEGGSRRVWQLAVVAAAGLPATAVILYLTLPRKVLVLAAMGFSRISGGEGGAGARSTGERLDTFHQAIALAKNSPIFGYGPGAFGYLNSGYDAIGNYPHNLFLELLVNGGLVGAMLFLLFVIPLGGRGMMALLKRPISWEIAVVGGLMLSSFVRFEGSFTVSAAKLAFFALGCVAGRKGVADTARPAERGVQGVSSAKIA